jgi:hypothetical protein
MKKKLLKISMLMYCLCILVTCDDVESKKTISPLVVDEQIIDFFDVALPTVTKSNCFFVSTENDICYIINSMEDFQAIYSCDDKLPEIDFTLYSLVLGQQKMPNSFYSVIEQNIDETKGLELNLYVQLPSGGHWPSFSQLYYWGIYPKLPNKKISVNIMK